MSFRSANQGYSEVSGMVVRELAKVQAHPQKPRLILGEERTPSPLMRGHPISTFFYRRIQYLIYPRPEQGKSLIRADGQKSVDCRGGNAEVRDTKAGMNPACRSHRSGDAPRGRREAILPRRWGRHPCSGRYYLEALGLSSNDFRERPR